MGEQHIGSTDYAIDRPSMKPKSDAYKLSLQGWIDEQCTQLDKAERALMHAEAGCRTKPEMRDDIITALRVIRAVHKEMVGW